MNNKKTPSRASEIRKSIKSLDFSKQLNTLIQAVASDT